MAIIENNIDMFIEAVLQDVNILTKIDEHYYGCYTFVQYAIKQHIDKNGNIYCEILKKNK